MSDQQNHETPTRVWGPLRVGVLAVSTIYLLNEYFTAGQDISRYELTNQRLLPPYEAGIVEGELYGLALLWIVMFVAAVWASGLMNPTLRRHRSVKTVGAVTVLSFVAIAMWFSIPFAIRMHSREPFSPCFGAHCGAVVRVEDAIGLWPEEEQASLRTHVVSNTLIESQEYFEFPHSHSLHYVHTSREGLVLVSDAHWLNPARNSSQVVAADLLQGFRQASQKRGTTLASCGESAVREALLQCFITWKPDGTASGNMLIVIDGDNVLTMLLSPAISQDARHFDSLTQSRLPALRSKAWRAVSGGK